MNFDGTKKSLTLNTNMNPVYLSTAAVLQLPLYSHTRIQFPPYLKSNRVIMKKCILSISLNYRFSVTPMLFNLTVIDSRTNELLGSTPFGEADFSTEWHTMNESFMIDVWDDRYITIILRFANDNSQVFEIKKNSYYKIDTV